MGILVKKMTSSIQYLDGFWKQHRDSFLIFLIGSVLALLAVVWLGFDLRRIGQVIIGDHFDSEINTWVLKQAIQNLLYRPTDLGYAPIFYGEPAPFAFTHAAYGLAIMMLPVYGLGGGNPIATYNIMVLLAFPLTAWAAFIFIRYVTQVDVLSAGIVALFLAFSPYQFWHINASETIALYAPLLTLYSFYRMLHEGRVRWAILTGFLAAWTMLISGYLGMILLIFIGVILLVRLPSIVKSKDYQILIRLLLSVIIGGLILVPFIQFRMQNPAFRVGYDQEYLRLVTSLSPVNLLRGFSLLYYDRTVTAAFHVPLFVGWIPLIMAFVGLRFSFIGSSAERQRNLLPFAILIAIGAVLALGTHLRLEVQSTTSLRLPYYYLSQLLGFRNLRIINRFILLSLVSLWVYAACGIAWLRGRKTKYSNLILAALLTFGFVEHVPYPWLLREQEDNHPRFGNQQAIPGDQPAYEWLRTQPDDLAVFHFPTQRSTRRNYLFSTWYYPQSRVSGESSMRPDWYGETIDKTILDVPSVSFLAERRTSLIMVHGEVAGIPDPRDQIAQYSRVWGGIQLVGTFGEIDVYQIDTTPSDTFFYDFDAPFLAAENGWGITGTTAQGITYQWMSAERADLEVFLQTDHPLLLQFQIKNAASPDLLDHLTLLVNGTPTSIQQIVTQEDGFRYEAYLTPTLLNDSSHYTQLSFEIPYVVPLSTGNRTNDFGVAFDWVRIELLKEQ